MRKLIHPDGSEVEYPNPLSITEIDKLLGDDGLDSFCLHDAEEHVVMVNDLSLLKRLPVNKVATEMYGKVCSGNNLTPIAGPVFVCPDSDFGD